MSYSVPLTSRVRPQRTWTRGLRAVGGALLPLAVIIGLVLLWEAVVRLFDVPLYLVPAPSVVAGEMARRWPSLMMHTWTTAYETVLAFVLSIAVGVPIGIAIVSSRWIDRTGYPLLVASQAIPKVAIAPLLTIWLGYGLTPKILVGLLVAFFPVVISTVVGLRSVPSDMLKLGRSMGLGPVGMFVRIGLPHALPSILGGLKVAIALSVVGAIVGEFTGADQGLGYLLLTSIGSLDTRLMFSALVLLVTLGVVLFVLVAGLERLLIPWHASQRENDLMRGSM